MIGFMIGAPGAGKSYELVVYHVLPALREGYRVITNLPLNVEAFAAIDPSYRDLIELRTTPQLVRGQFDADPVSRGWPAGEMFHIEGAPAGEGVTADLSNWQPHAGRVFSNVWDYYSDWRHPKTGNGPKFIIDECHLALPRMGTDKAVAEYFSKHRHFLVNILLATQSAPKVDVDIKDMVQTCYRLRKATAFGRQDQYIRRVLDGVGGSVVQEDVRDYQPQYFRLYKSHTQSDSAGQEQSVEDVTPFIVKWRRWTRAVLGLGLVGVLIAVPWAIHSQGSKSKQAASVAAPPVKVAQAQPGLPAWAADAGVVALPPALPTSAPPKAQEGPPEPFEGKGVHVVGRFTFRDRVSLFFAVSQNAVVVATYGQRDLETMGYRVEYMTDCAAVITWRKSVRTVTCDTPAQTIAPGGGTASAPQPSATASRT